jgi:hypothetical protein
LPSLDVKVVGLRFFEPYASLSHSPVRVWDVRSNAGGGADAIAVAEAGGVKLLLKFYMGSGERVGKIKGLASRLEEVSRRIDRAVSRAASIPGIAGAEVKIGAAVKLGLAPPVGECFLPGGHCLVYPAVEKRGIVEMKPDKPLYDVGGARRLFCSVLSAARLIEDAGVVHGDLNPHNIVISPSGPVIVDFDGATVFSVSGGRKVFTRGPPYFLFDMESGPLIFEPPVLNDDSLRLDYIDYLEILYLGLIVAAATDAAFQDLRPRCCRDLGGGLKEKIGEVLGRAFADHVEAAIQGSVKAPPDRPLRALYNDMRGEGVCP